MFAENRGKYISPDLNDSVLLCESYKALESREDRKGFLHLPSVPSKVGWEEEQEASSSFKSLHALKHSP